LSKKQKRREWKVLIKERRRIEIKIGGRKKEKREMAQRNGRNCHEHAAAAAAAQRARERHTNKSARYQIIS
jgi:hypothetical protein